MSIHVTASHQSPRPGWLWHMTVIASVVVWWLAYQQLIPVSEWITARFPVERHSHTGEAIAFFFYDVPKVMMLLALIVFAMGVIRSFFSPERTRALLAGKREGVGNVLAALMGILTPFLLLFSCALVYRACVCGCAVGRDIFLSNICPHGE